MAPLRKRTTTTSPLAWRLWTAGLMASTRTVRNASSPFEPGWKGRPHLKQKWPRSDRKAPLTWFQRMVMLEIT